jgi:hypothetical protein
VRRFLTLLVLAFAGARALAPAQPVGTFNGELQAWGHLLAGGLIATYLYDPHEKLGGSRYYLFLGLSLSFWELGAYLIQRFA